MGWEPRNGGVYFYRAARRDGRVVRTYLGNGAAAALAAEIDAEAKARRRAEAEALAAERARLAPADGVMAALDRACRLVLEAALLADGYRRRNYSRWRRRRVRQAGRG